jgi:hypothetical protein
MTALDLDHGIAGVGGKGACWNAGHCGRRRRQGCERHGYKACLDVSFHWDLLHRVARQLAQVPERIFVPAASFSIRAVQNSASGSVRIRHCHFFPNILAAVELSR